MVTSMTTEGSGRPYSELGVRHDARAATTVMSELAGFTTHGFLGALGLLVLLTESGNGEPPPKLYFDKDGSAVYEPAIVGARAERLDNRFRALLTFPGVDFSSARPENPQARSRRPKAKGAGRPAAGQLAVTMMAGDSVRPRGRQGSAGHEWPASASPPPGHPFCRGTNQAETQRLQASQRVSPAQATPGNVRRASFRKVVEEAGVRPAGRFQANGVVGGTAAQVDGHPTWLEFQEWEWDERAYPQSWTRFCDSTKLEVTERGEPRVASADLVLFSGTRTVMQAMSTEHSILLPKLTSSPLGRMVLDNVLWQTSGKTAFCYTPRGGGGAAAYGREDANPVMPVLEVLMALAASTYPPRLARLKQNGQKSKGAPVVAWRLWSVPLTLVAAYHFLRSERDYSGGREFYSLVRQRGNWHYLSEAVAGVAL